MFILFKNQPTDLYSCKNIFWKFTRRKKSHLKTQTQEGLFLMNEQVIKLNFKRKITCLLSRSQCFFFRISLFFSLLTTAVNHLLHLFCQHFLHRACYDCVHRRKDKSVKSENHVPSCWQSPLRDHAIKVENNMSSRPKSKIDNDRYWDMVGRYSMSELEKIHPDVWEKPKTIAAAKFTLFLFFFSPPPALRLKSWRKRCELLTLNRWIVP